MKVNNKFNLYKKNGVWIYLLAFIIPILILMILFKILQIAPFGDNSLLAIDLWGQYFPMYIQQYSNTSLSEYLYSFNGAFGFNSFAQSAYYCNSVFWLFFKFFKVENLISVLDIICVLKFGFASVTCLAYLRKKLKSESSFLLVGAVSYAFCAYCLAYISQCMWTDAVILLPLVLIGLERMLEKKSPVMYTLLLAFTIITNFYIGYSICIFLAVYFVAEMLLKVKVKFISFRPKFENMKAIGKDVLCFSVFSILSAGISALVIIPVAKALSLTAASEAQFPDQFTWYHSLPEYINAMLPNTPLSLEYGVPNIAISLMFFLLVPMYFLNRKISIRNKVIYGVVLVFLYCSMNLNVLDYIWHGFHFPNQLPGRWTFIFSFMLILMGCKGFITYKGLDYKTVFGSWIVSVALIYFSKYGLEDTADAVVQSGHDNLMVRCVISISVVALIIYILLFSMNIKEKSYSKILTKALVVILVVTNIGFVASNVANIYSSELRMTNAVDYNNSTSFVRKYGALTDCGNSDFYRVAIGTNFTFDSGLVGNYKDLTYYSSTMNYDVYKILESLGNRVYAKNVSTIYNCNSPVMNSIFSVNKIIDGSKGLNLPGTILSETYDDCNIYNNQMPLGLVFPVSSSILDWAVSEEPKGIENQNNLLNFMLGDEFNVFEKIECQSLNTESATVQQNDDWNANYYQMTAGSSSAAIHYSYVCTADGPVYIEQNYRVGDMTVSSANHTTVSLNPKNERFKYIGDYKNGEVINIDISISDTAYGLAGVNLYTFNESKWNEAYSKLSSSQYEVESFKTTRIKGKITMKNGSNLFTSIIQDGGWSVYCDGQKIKPMLIGESFIGFYLPQGEHTVEFVYHVPGFRSGIVISVISLAIMVLLCGRSRITRKSLQKESLLQLKKKKLREKR